MDYQALGFGDAASVVTAVTIDKDKHAIMISCLYDPQDAQMPYTLCFKQCEDIAWQTFDDLRDLQQLDAELIGISLGTSGTQLNPDEVLPPSLEGIGQAGPLLDLPDDGCSLRMTAARKLWHPSYIF